MENMQFYEKLSEQGKKHYDELEKIQPHTDKFKELMNRTERTSRYMYFTEEEREYLGKEDLPTFTELFEGDSQSYMDNC